MSALPIELNQTLLSGGQCLPIAVVARAAEAVARALRVKRSVPISVAFISAKEIRRLNKAYRGKDKVTDVLSFQEGEILLCYAQAKRQAAELGHSVRDENIFLLVHGLLHVFGYDHEKPADARRMFPLQKRILDSLGIDSRL